VVEEYPCESKNQLHTRERYHMELLHATLNKCIPTRTQKEYKKDNAERVKEYQKEYQKEYKEHYREYDKKYRKDNADKIKTRLKAYNSEKIPCPCCNKILNRSSMNKHIRTQHTE
jgi:formamidopyrimidine-DNA glycosylase